MYLLSLLIKVDEVFRIGTVMSVITLVFAWIVYFLYDRLKERKLLVTGITFLLAVPFVLLVNITLSRMIGGTAVDIWDMLSVFVLLITAAAFIMGDYAQKKGYVK